MVIQQETGGLVQFEITSDKGSDSNTRPLLPKQVLTNESRKNRGFAHGNQQKPPV